MRDTYTWVTQYTQTKNEHWLEEGRPSPDEPFPPYDYLALLFEIQDKITEKLEEYRAKGMDDFSLNIYRMRMEREARQTRDQPALIGRQHGRIPIRR